MKAKQNIENILAKTQTRIKKAMKNNLTNIKFKEMASRIKHEYCTDSKFNQLIRSFYEFIILVGDKIESREDASMVIEMCK